MTQRVTSPSNGLHSAYSGSPSLAARSAQASPRVKFDVDQIKPYMKKLLASTLQGAQWEAREKQRIRGWCNEISERVKDRMLEVEPRGFKYIVTTQIYENLGQGGLASLVSHWEDSDTVTQEMFSSDSLICVCIAYAVRTA
ncbi:hypothetical protein CALVIDRAFT_503249 [Calocera viscosa TUFC12733]|uniref:Topoisomerase I damage affected protein 2 n=1 Tax=Calocera viscosa (strain TUFC12733) TaxID=1330018 RepID=A0A167J502_CALVF|nr:hypothetical protein CALVIDRAFT_503249 [Calocera viscosa TUFC12733]